MTIRAIGYVASLGLSINACAGEQKIDPSRLFPPGRTVFLPIPVQSSSNHSPLAYVVKADSAVDYAAPIVKGTVTTRQSSADISEVVEAADGLRIAGGLDQIRLAAGTNDVTHVIVDARVEQVHVVRDIKYNKRSQCCADRKPTVSCRSGYVGAVMVGTGTVTYARLRKAPAGGSKRGRPGAVGRDDLEAIKKRPFEASFFAFTAESSYRACEFSK